MGGFLGDRGRPGGSDGTQGTAAECEPGAGPGGLRAQGRDCILSSKDERRHEGTVTVTMRAKSGTSGVGARELTLKGAGNRQVRPPEGALSGHRFRASTWTLQLPGKGLQQAPPLTFVQQLQGQSKLSACLCNIQARRGLQMSPGRWDGGPGLACFRSSLHSASSCPLPT